MAERWIADASVLICLAKAGHLPLLSELSPALFIPTAVLEEILAGPPGDPARLALSQGWGTRLPLTTALPQVLEWGLGAGESAVLSACLTEPSSSVALIDDGEARACARALGLKVKGTLGVIILAAKLVPRGSSPPPKKRGQIVEGKAEEGRRGTATSTTDNDALGDLDRFDAVGDLRRAVLRVDP